MTLPEDWNDIFIVISHEWYWLFQTETIALCPQEFSPYTLPSPLMEKLFTFSKTSHWMLHFRIFYHWIYTFVCVLSLFSLRFQKEKKKKPYFFLYKSDLQVYGQDCIHLSFFKEIPSLIMPSLTSLFLCLPLQENCSLTTCVFWFPPSFPHPF